MTVKKMNLMKVTFRIKFLILVSGSSSRGIGSGEKQRKRKRWGRPIKNRSQLKNQRPRKRKTNMGQRNSRLVTIKMTMVLKLSNEYHK